VIVTSGHRAFASPNLVFVDSDESRPGADKVANRVKVEPDSAHNRRLSLSGLMPFSLEDCTTSSPFEMRLPTLIL